MKTIKLLLLFIALCSCNRKNFSDKTDTATIAFDYAVQERYSEWKGYNNYQWHVPQDSLTQKGLEILANIDSLNFEGYYVFSKIPKEILKCPKLKYINLLGRNINWKQSMPILEQLNPQVELYVSVRDFDSIPKFLWKQIMGIQILKIRLTEIPENVLQNTQLKYLKLSTYTPNYANKLSNLSKIGTLSQLVYLNLQFCQVDTLPSEIFNLTKLTILDVSNNQIKILPTEIGNLVNLTELNLNKNQLTTLPAEIGNLINLKDLYIGENNLTILPSEIGRLTNLETLIVWYNQLTTLPAQIKNLHNLKVFFLSDNKFSNQYVDEIDSIIKCFPHCQLIPFL